MGRYDFRPLRVHQAATQLLSTQRITTPPPWFDTVAAIPPAQALVRPLLRHRSPRSKNSRNKKPSRMFAPQRIAYPEDALRRDFFGDHPWELARPRVVLEDDGRDAGRWDWSRIQQVGRRLDGESVVQRQMWLIQHAGLSKQAAYDKARREFYHFRHLEDVERRVAKEEALATGAYFGKTALEVGMELEDKAFEDWKAWAMKEVAALKQAQGAMYTGPENDDAAIAPEDQETVEGLQEVEGSVPNNGRGQLALGGAALRP